jgi:hypothetical protein
VKGRRREVWRDGTESSTGGCEEGDSSEGKR